MLTVENRPKYHLAWGSDTVLPSGHYKKHDAANLGKDLFVFGALKCKESKQVKVIAFNWSGHGHFDMGAYEEYLVGRLEDYAYPAEAIAKALAELPKVEG